MNEISTIIDRYEGRPIRITDLTPRDGQQCKLATRVHTDDLLPICEKMDNVGFYAVEVWGGATYDVCLRYLHEDPWERLRRIKQVMPETRLQMLLRGQTIVGYRPRSDRVVKAFVERACANGIQVFRVFDSLNDFRNIELAVKAIRAAGGEVHAEISYTVSPVHTYERWIQLARQLVDLEPDWISLKDATGIMMPFDAYRLIRGIREASGCKIPVLLHNHDMSGTALMNHMMAVLAGAEMLDTVMSPLAFGSSHPATESVVAALRGTPYDTGLDIRALDEVAELVTKLRRKYTRYETEYSGVNSKVLIHKLPGGMISNMVAQLTEAGAADRMNEALEEIPRVSTDLGHPPLLTPSSQIVGVQAVLNVIQGKRYETITREVRDYVSGLYGRPPGPVSAELARTVLGDEVPQTDARPGDLADPDEWDEAERELGELGQSDEDKLLYLLFPMQAREFLSARDRGELPAAPLHLSEDVPPGYMAPVDFELVFHGEKYKVNVEAASNFADESRPRKYYIRVDGRLEEIQLSPQRLVAPGQRVGVSGGGPGNGIPKASLPGDAVPVIAGKVVKILIAEGDTVERGQPVACVEAMKMENEVLAPASGVVQRVFAKRGDSVDTDDALLRIET